MEAETSEVAGIEVRWHELVPERLGLWVPVRPDDLVEALSPAEIRAAGGRHIPYFGTLWPAGEALARHVLEAEDLLGQPFLDLGCGVGAVGLAALHRGAAVTFLDWEPRSLELVWHSAHAQGLVPHALVEGSWHRPPALPEYARILAADVMYEKSDVAPVTRFVAAHLAPGAEAWLADPRRLPAERLPAAAAQAGLELRSSSPLAYRPRGIRVDLHRLARSPRRPS